jgi:hypothetical protein
MHEEFCRGHEIVDKLWKQHQSNPSDPLVWNELFEPSDFFISYPNYLSFCIVGPTQADAQAWIGFVESRLRKLVSDMLGRSLPLSKIQLWPKKFEMCIADKAALLTQAQRKNCITYFVGFQVETLRMRGNQLNVEMQLQNFREWELSRFQPLVPGMDVLVKPFKVKELPKAVFESGYKGGKEEAMKKRRQLRNSDPRRQEKKRLARLQELKAKMAEMQRKREGESENPMEDTEDAEGKSLDRKRKREEGTDEDDIESKMVKIEDADDQIGSDEAGSELQLSEELNLLEHALDAIQQDASTGAKTREEAEADRQKLLAGALLVEGDVLSDEDDETGYMGDGARQILLPAVKVKSNSAKRDIRSLPLGEEEAEILRKAGCAIVSDEDTTIVGGDMILPWRRPEVVEGNSHEKKPIAFAKINFLTKFDIVELDANGYVVDKGDEDFTPSLKWSGRKAGFEFKLGERGLGYYRTGKKVVVPSNTAY